MSPNPLFSQVMIFDLMEERQAQLRERIRTMDSATLQQQNLAEMLAKDFGLSVPVLDEQNRYATTREVDVDVSQDPRRHIWDRSQPFFMRANEITIHVPFQGDASLFDVRPQHFNLNPPIGAVEDDELNFTYNEIEPRDVTPEFEGTLQQVKQHLEWLRPSGDQLATQLLQLATLLIAERKQRLEAHGQALSKLGIPIREGLPATVMQSNPPAVAGTAKVQPGRGWDVFISHASEDKEAIARRLADALIAMGLDVWYDEFSLKLGDSLRGSIDRGLARSRYGVVILSPHFFEKHWPQQELNGLATREVNGTKVILPVWHNVVFEDVRAFSPTLADRVAVNTDKGFDSVVKSILDAMK